MPSSPARVDCRWGMAMCRLSGAAKTSPSLVEGARSPCRLALAGPWGPSISSTTRCSTRSSTAGLAGTNLQQLAMMALQSHGESRLCTTRGSQHTPGGGGPVVLAAGGQACSSKGELSMK